MAHSDGSGEIDLPIGRAVQAGLEDPALGSLYAMLAWLGRHCGETAETLSKYTVTRLGIFLPAARARLLADALLLGRPESTPDGSGSAISDQFVAINLLEAIDGLPKESRSCLLKDLEAVEWLAPHLGSAARYLARAKTTVIKDRLLDVQLHFAGSGGTESSDSSDVVPLRTKGVHLRAVRVGHNWMARHDSAGGVELKFDGRCWPAGHTLWIKSNETLAFGDECIDVTSLNLLASLAQAEGESARWRLIPSPGSILLSRGGEGEGAGLVIGPGFVVEPGGEVPVLVNGAVVTAPLALLPRDTLNFGTYHGLALRLLRAAPTGRATSGWPIWAIRLEHASLRFPDGSQGLNDVSFSIEAGDFVAVMGPSGCGKSTLLGLLSGERRLTSGAMTIDDAFIGQPPVMALVPQDDILFENLTVEENLRFAAALRGAAANEGYDALIQSTLEGIHLKTKRNLKAGGVTSKVLSGGERKRLNIGLELTGQPDALLLDEPTSGLSSADAIDVMRLLRARADTGTLVLAVVHQPPRKAFEMFDKLIVMDVGGRLAFFGNPADAAAYFGRMAPGGKLQVEGILDLMVGRRSTLDGRAGVRRTFDPDFWRLKYDETRHLYEAPLILIEGESTPAPIAEPKGHDIRSRAHTILAREWLRWKRDWKSVLATCGVALGLALVVSIVCRTKATNAPYWFANNSSLGPWCFLSVILVQFLALSVSVQEMVKDRAVRMRERMLNVPGWMWLLGKIPALTLMCGVFSALVVIAGIVTLGLPYAWCALWTGLWLTGCCSAALGLLVSSLPRMTERTAMAAVPLLLVPQMVMSGADPFSFDKLSHLHWPAPRPADEVQALHNAPWAADLMASRWAYQAVVCALRDDPFQVLLRDKSLRKEWVFASSNIDLLEQNPGDFWHQMSDVLKRDSSPAVLRGDVAAMVAAGYLSRGEVLTNLRGFVGDEDMNLTDHASWMNDVFLSYAERTFPLHQKSGESPFSPMGAAWAVLGWLTLTFTSSAAIILWIQWRWSCLGPPPRSRASSVK